jgi:hypothetical protein
MSFEVHYSFDLRAVSKRSASILNCGALFSGLSVQAEATTSRALPDEERCPRGLDLDLAKSAGVVLA